MDEFEENYFNFQFVENYYPHEKNNENFYNENNKIEDQKVPSTGENHNSNKVNSEKNDLNENQLINAPNNIYNNFEDIINIEKNSDNKNILGDGLVVNLDIFQNNNIIEQPNLNRETHTSQYNTVNGKQIITTNEMITNKLQELYPNPEINIENLKGMQYLKVKRRRRKKSEIERDKENNKEEKVQKKPGRIKKSLKSIEQKNVNHPKESDDNIIKKINTFYVEEIRNWLNKSFLNEKFSNFQNTKYREKVKKEFFMKLSPKLISTKIKKELILKTLNTKFKDIFYYNQISSKYKNAKSDNNKQLIDKIYKEGNQIFVIFILEMTFLEGLNFFNGQIPDQDIISFFKQKYNFPDKLINDFVGNFGKIGKLLEKLYKTGVKNGEDTKDYLTRLNVLCLNYKQSFESKYNRRESKDVDKEKKKPKINKGGDNSNN